METVDTEQPQNFAIFDKDIISPFFVLVKYTITYFEIKINILRKFFVIFKKIRKSIV